MRTGDLISGRYRLEAMLGSGGNGVVWSAFDTKLEREVAVKRPHSTQGDPDRLVFRREAKHAAQVHHPNAISVFDAVDTDECWLVMEYLPSESLDKILTADGPLPPERVARIGMQIAAALHAAHSQGVVHRDVKPGNVLVSGGDLAKLTDFGISIWREVTLTSNGKISGTAAYAAPEVANGLPATTASDVFSLGATLFTAVEGTPPFGTGAPEAIFARARSGQIPDMHRAGPLGALLSDMLECRRPRMRPDADEVRRRLKEILGDWEPPQRAQTDTPAPNERITAPGRRPTDRSVSAPAEPALEAPPKRSPEGGRRRWRLGAALVAVAVLVATFAFVRNIRSDQSNGNYANTNTTPSVGSSSATIPTTTITTTPSTTPSTSRRPQLPPPPRTTSRSTTTSSTRAPINQPPTTTCQEHERYRVKEKGEIHDAADKKIAYVYEGNIFVRYDSSTNVPNRYFGTANGITGYVLERKLEPDGTVTVCE